MKSSITRSCRVIRSNSRCNARMTSLLVSTIAFLLCCSIARIAATKSKTYQVQIDVNGTRVCSASQPTTVISMSAGTLDGQCGVQCSVSSFCKFYQFKVELAQCEIFYDEPVKSSMAVVDRCTAYASLTRDHTMTFVNTIPGIFPVLAMSLLYDRLFFTLANGEARVSVYNTTSFLPQNPITFSGLGVYLYGLATSCIQNFTYLFVSDYANRCVHMVNLTATTSINNVTWPVSGSPNALSVNSIGTVFVTFSDDTIAMYTSSGQLIRSIAPISGIRITYAVQAAEGSWMVSRSGAVNGVAIISNNGTVIRSFGAGAGSGRTQMNCPNAIAIDADGYIIVADRYNDRILLVNPTLTEARQLSLPNGTALTSPYAISLDRSSGRLYIGEYVGQNRILVFDGY